LWSSRLSHSVYIVVVTNDCLYTITSDIERDITDITGTPNSSTVTYKSAVLTLTGTRTLKYAGNTIFINIAATDRELLEDVSSFNLSYTYLNLDDDTDTPPVDEVANIEVTFSLEGIGKNFRTNIFPRNLVKKTW
jgi:hypothetical protein